MTEQVKKALADTLVELFHKNGKVRDALYACVCECPNLIVEY